MRGIAVLAILAALAAADVGERLAEAQAKGDILEVQRLLREVRPGGAQQLHALMKQLDPKRAGAFVSAPCLARGLLLEATATGDTRFVADAASVLRAHAARKGSGKCADAMRRYAEGLESVAKGEDGKGAIHLGKALAVALDEGWTPLAMHVAVELATVSLRQGEPGAAARAIASLGIVFPGDADPSLRNVIRSLYGNRLNDAPEEVKRAFEKVMEPHRGGISVSAAGGAPGTPGTRSKVGEALATYPKTKPLVTVQRTAKGFEIREGFDRSFSATQPFLHGTKYHADGGVTLGFWNHAVGLHMVDPTGRNGQPGESSAGPGPADAYYFLARKETWSVTKEGVVSIR